MGRTRVSRKFQVTCVLLWLCLCQAIKADVSCAADYTVEQSGIVVECKFSQSIKNTGFTLSYRRTSESLQYDQLVVSCPWTADQETPTCWAANKYKMIQAGVISDRVTFRIDRDVPIPRLFKCKLIQFTLSGPQTECGVNVTDIHKTAGTTKAIPTTWTSPPGTPAKPVDTTKSTRDVSDSADTPQAATDNTGIAVGVPIAVVVVLAIVGLILYFLCYRQRRNRSSALKNCIFPKCCLEPNSTVQKHGEIGVERKDVDTEDEIGDVEMDSRDNNEAAQPMLPHKGNKEPESTTTSVIPGIQADRQNNAHQRPAEPKTELNTTDIPVARKENSSGENTQNVNTNTGAINPKKSITPANLDTLLRASREGQADKVRDILSTRPDIIHHTDEEGKTALYWASRYGHRDVVGMLLDKGADINKQNKDGDTALLTASLYGHRDVVELLLERKADFNICDVDGCGPLHVAALKGHADCVRSLLSHGAPCDIRTTTNGWTPLTIAAKNGREEVVTALLQHRADVEMCVKSGFTPLYWASQEGHDKTVNLLVEKGADVNKAHNDGMTPLWTAAYKGHVSVVSSLLSHANIDINKADNDSSTPLFVASREGKVDVVRLLLDAGVEVDRKDKEDVTPLFVASQNGHTEVVKLLLQHHADPNSRTDKLVTPLIIASTKGHEDVVCALLASGADVSLKDKWGDTALDWARENNHHTGIVNMLQQKMKE